MEEIVGVPDDIDVDVEWIKEQIWFQASIPKLPGDGDRSLVAMRQRNERLNRCPVLRVPADVVVVLDPGLDDFIHLRTRLDVLCIS